MLSFSRWTSSFPARDTPIVTRKPRGMDTIPGFSSGNNAPAPITVGLININPTDATRPVNIPATIPISVHLFQKRVQINAGIFADAAIANANPTRNATF